jgi:hypothetical protein
MSEPEPAQLATLLVDAWSQRRELSSRSGGVEMEAAPSQRQRQAPSRPDLRALRRPLSAYGSSCSCSAAAVLPCTTPGSNTSQRSDGRNRFPSSASSRSLADVSSRCSGFWRFCPASSGRRPWSGMSHCNGTSLSSCYNSSSSLPRGSGVSPDSGLHSLAGESPLRAAGRARPAPLLSELPIGARRPPTGPGIEMFTWIYLTSQLAPV